MTRTIKTLTWLILAIRLGSWSAFAGETWGTRELYRIRIANRECGPVEVSADGGRTYSRVGKVLRPATTTYEGYIASIYAQPSTVAATAVHGIRIKVGGKPGCERERSQTISIIPWEFASVPTGFGGHVAGSSGIYTDIPTGKGIFRNLAPFVGNPVLRQTATGPIILGENYLPTIGDVLVITVTVPARYPKEMVFENRKDGLVKAVYEDGEETIARVERPVRGVGRFDATGYTGVGRINTNHTGVITISTAPIANGAKDGSSHETRGGFMIQPSHHAKGNFETAQIMVVASLSGGDTWLEGNPPLFSGYIGLASDPSDSRESFQVDIRTSISDWRPLPEVVGKNDRALESLSNGAGSVTAVRIRFPELSPAWIRSQLERCSRAYLEACRAQAARKGTIVSDPTLILRVNTSGLAQVKLVSFYLDGEFKGASNTPPYSFSLDTRALSPGEHVAVIRAVDESGSTLRRVAQTFFIQGEGSGSPEAR